MTELQPVPELVTLDCSFTLCCCKTSALSFTQIEVADERDQPYYKLICTKQINNSVSYIKKYI